MGKFKDLPEDHRTEKSQRNPRQLRSVASYNHSIDEDDASDPGRRQIQQCSGNHAHHDEGQKMPMVSYINEKALRLVSVHPYLSSAGLSQLSFERKTIS